MSREDNIFSGKLYIKKREVSPKPFSISKCVRDETVEKKYYRKPSKIVCFFSTQKRGFTKYLREFCHNTSIPGFKYIVEPYLHHAERLLWILGIIFAFIVCILLIVQTLNNWTKSPVILAMDRSVRTVWQVPFPAVTVCPISKVQASKFKFTEVAKDVNSNKSVSPEDLRILSDTALQCENIPKGTPGVLKNSSTIDTIEELALDMQKMHVYMSFRSQTQKPDIMKRLLTEEGLCFSFNMLPNNFMFRNGTFHASRDYLKHDEPLDVRWSPREGYSSSAGLSTYPRRVLGPGTMESFLFVLAVEENNLDDWCSRALRGYKVVLHSPAEIPRPRLQAVMVPLDMEAQVGVAPFEVRTDEDVRANYEAALRRCVFADERPLRFFQQYTQQNCEIECLANATLANCGCVEFHMPRELETNICGAEMLFCTKHVATNLQALSANAQGGQFEVTHPNMDIKECRCLPLCSYLHYEDARTGLSDFDIKSYQNINNFTGNDTHYVRVIVYFKDSKYIPMLRVEHYKTLTLIANCGGLLGLCLGMSFLSIAEVLYWLLVRPWHFGKRRVAPDVNSTSIHPHRSVPGVHIY